MRNPVKLLCLVALLASSSQVQAFESVCRKLSVSTDISLSTDDIIKEGQPIDKWTRNTINPEIVPSNILIDYLYVTIDNHKPALDAKAFHLEFDDHFFADSAISLESKKQAKTSTTYSLEIKYRCKEYGGALIDYQLDINVPECGQSHIFWKKICGNPLVAREGLTMNVEYHKYNQTIVKNGVLIDASYFDKDLDNYVFQVPSNVNSTTFYLQMDINQNDTQLDTADKKTKEFFANAENGEKSEPEDSQSEFQILEAILKMIPEVKISQPIVDADQSILNPILSGDLSSGGIITDDAQTITLDYNCISAGQTTIELSIPLDYFKDINLIFVKQCFIDSDGAIQSDYANGATSIFTRFFYVCIIIALFYILYSVIFKQKSIPEATSVIFLFFQLLFRSIISKQQPELRHGRGYANTNDEDYESEFRVEQVDQNQGTYGSI